MDNSRFQNLFLSSLAIAVMLSSCAVKGCFDPGDDGDEVKSIIRRIYPLNENNCDTSLTFIAEPKPGYKEEDFRFPWQSLQYNVNSKNEQKDDGGSKSDFFVYEGRRASMTIKGELNLAGYTITKDVPLKIKKLKYKSSSGTVKEIYNSELIPIPLFTVPGSDVSISLIPKGDEQVPTINGVKLHNGLGLFAVLMPATSSILGKYGDSDKWSCHTGLALSSRCDSDNISGCTDTLDFKNCDPQHRNSWCSGNLNANGALRDAYLIADDAEDHSNKVFKALSQREVLRFPLFVRSDTTRKQVARAFGLDSTYNGVNYSSGRTNKRGSQVAVVNFTRQCSTIYSIPWSNLPEFAMCTHNHTIANWATNMTPSNVPKPQIAEMYNVGPVSRWYFTDQGETCEQIDRRYKIKETSSLYGGYYNYVLSNSRVFWGSDYDSPTLDCDGNSEGTPFCYEKRGYSRSKITPTICPNNSGIKLKWPMQIIAANITLTDNNTLGNISNCKLYAHTSRGSYSLSFTKDDTVSDIWPTFPAMFVSGDTVNFNVSEEKYEQGHRPNKCSNSWWWSIATEAAEIYSSIVGPKFCSTALAYAIKPLSFISCFGNYRSGCLNKRVPAEHCGSSIQIGDNEDNTTPIGSCIKKVAGVEYPQSYRNPVSPQVNTLINSGPIFSVAENIRVEHCGACIKRSLPLDARTKLRTVSSNEDFSDSTISAAIKTQTQCEEDTDYTWTRQFLDARTNENIVYTFNVNERSSFCPDPEGQRREKDNLRSLTNFLYQYKIGNIMYGGIFANNGTNTSTTLRIPDDGQTYTLAVGYSGNGSDLDSMFSEQDKIDNVLYRKGATISSSAATPSKTDRDLYKSNTITFASGKVVKNGDRVFLYIQEFKKDSAGNYTNVLDPNKHPQVIFGEKTHHDDIYRKIQSDKSLPVLQFSALDMADGFADGMASWISNHSGKVWVAALDTTPIDLSMRVTDGKMIVFDPDALKDNVDPVTTSNLENVLYYNTGTYKIAASTKSPATGLGASTGGWISNSINVAFVEMVKTVFFGRSIVDSGSCKTIIKLKSEEKEKERDDSDVTIRIGEAEVNIETGFGSPTPAQSICQPNGEMNTTITTPYNPAHIGCKQCIRPTFNKTPLSSSNRDTIDGKQACVHLGEERYECNSLLLSVCNGKDYNISLPTEIISDYAKLDTVSDSSDTVTICPQTSQTDISHGLKYYLCNQAKGSATVNCQLVNKGTDGDLFFTGIRKPIKASKYGGCSIQCEDGSNTCDDYKKIKKCNIYNIVLQSNPDFNSCLSKTYTDTTCWHIAQASQNETSIVTFSYPFGDIQNDDFTRDSVVPPCNINDPKPYKSFSNCSTKMETYGNHNIRVSKCDITRRCVPDRTAQVTTRQVAVGSSIANTDINTTSSITNPAQQVKSVSNCKGSNYQDIVAYEYCSGQDASRNNVSGVCRRVKTLDCTECNRLIVDGVLLTERSGSGILDCTFADNTRIYCTSPGFNACKGFSVPNVSLSTDSSDRITICNTTTVISTDTTFSTSIPYGASIGISKEESMRPLEYICDGIAKCTYASQDPRNTQNTESVPQDSTTSPNTNATADSALYEKVEVCDGGRDWKAGLVYLAFNNFSTNINLQIIIYITLMLVLTMKGYHVILGEEQLDMTSILKDALNLSITFGLFMPGTWGMYQKYIVSATLNMMDGLNMIVVQALNPMDAELKNMFGPIDLIFDGIFLKVTTWYRILAILLSDITGFIYVIIILFAFFSYIMIFSRSVINYLSSLIMVGLYLTVGPLFILFRIHPRTAQYFTNWWQGLMGFMAAQCYMFSIISLFTTLYLHIVEAILYFKVCYRSIITIPVVNISILGWWVVANEIPNRLKPFINSNYGLSSTSTGAYPTLSEIVTLLIIVATMEKFLTTPLFGGNAGMDNFFNSIAKGITKFRAAGRDVATNAALAPAKKIGSLAVKGANKSYNAAANRISRKKGAGKEGGEQEKGKGK